MGDCCWMVDCNVIFKFYFGIFYLYIYYNIWYFFGSKMFFYFILFIVNYFNLEIKKNVIN